MSKAVLQEHKEKKKRQRKKCKIPICTSLALKIQEISSKRPGPHETVGGRWGVAICLCVFSKFEVPTNVCVGERVTGFIIRILKMLHSVCADIIA